MRVSPMFLLAFSLSALAAPPLEFAHQGRIADASGAPLAGAHDLVFTLYDAPAGGAAQWTETAPGVLFTDGFYALDLGQSSPFDLDTFEFAAGGLWLELAVDGASPLPQRLPLQSVPYAFVAARAAVATSVAGGPIDATELTVNGLPVIGSDGTIAWSNITGAPQQLGALQCTSAGQIASWTGSAWSCSAANQHDHSAEQITSGTLSLAVIPIGTSDNTVARGNHTHTALDLDLGPNDPTNPLNHARYTDDEARAAVGPHTTRYTDDEARAAVGPHTTRYTDDEAVAAVDATGAYLPAAGGAMTGDLDLGGNALKGVGNFWWGRLSIASGAWSTSDGRSGTLVIPANGAEACDTSTWACVHTYSASEHRILFEIPAWDQDWLGGGNASKPGAMCWATSTGDNEGTQHEAFGDGAISVGTDSNGNCTKTSSDMSNCAWVDVRSSFISHDVYGVFCYLP